MYKYDAIQHTKRGEIVRGTDLTAVVSPQAMYVRVRVWCVYYVRLHWTRKCMYRVLKGYYTCTL